MKSISIVLFGFFVMFSACILWHKLLWHLFTHIKWLAGNQTKEWRDAFTDFHGKERG